MDTHFAPLFQLFRRDLLTFLRQFPRLFSDTLIFFVVNAIVWGYVMPQEWMSHQYGPFLIVGAVGSFGLIEVTGKISVLIADIEGERTIAQLLILPISSRALFCYIATFWAFTSALLTLPLLPLGKLLLLRQFSFEHTSYFRLALIFVTINLFYGFFALWIVSLLKGLGGLNGLWARVVSPMWSLGAYFYSWKASYALSPLVGSLSLINPMVYAMEGMRSAIFGPAGYLPYGLCLGVLWIFILGLGMHGVRRLKKRLDCL